MSRCDRTPHRSDVSVSPTRARAHACGVRVYWVAPDAQAQNGFLPRHACARRARRRRPAIHHREQNDQNIRRRLVRRRVRASDNVLGGSQARQWRLTYTRAHCEFEQKKPSDQERTNFWYDACRTGLATVKEGRASFTP